MRDARASNHLVSDHAMRVFFGYDYKRDGQRASIVRNGWATEVEAAATKAGR